MYFRCMALMFALLCMLVMTGCRVARAWDDLSVPVAWQEEYATGAIVVQGGKSLPIVTNDEPRNRWAAMLLAGIIEEMTGVRPAVLVERPGQACKIQEGLMIGAVQSNVGWECSLVDESDEAFRVISRDGSVRFVGRADFAVFDWCERELGVRYYCGIGMCVGKSNEIVVNKVDYSDRPVFTYRELGNRNPESWVKFSKAGVSHRGGVSVHQPQGWFLDEQLKMELPHIFESGETPMLCYGNPQTLGYYKQRIDEHINGVRDSGGIVNTNRKVVTVCQWDAPIKCKCKDCDKLYDDSLGRNGNASPIIWGRFLTGLSKWLADAHPDYMISFLPYLNTCEVPNEMLHLANAEAEVCTMPGLALLKNSRCKKNEERIIRSWYEVTGRKVLNWHYGCWPQEWTSAPYVFGHVIKKHYSDMKDFVCGSYICGGSRDPRLAVSMYVWMRCLWNPEVDVEAIYDGFASRMFGPAARQMRELISLQERCWSRQWENDDCDFHNVSEVSFRAEDIERMKTLIMEADAIASESGDINSVKRIRWYASGIERYVLERELISQRTGRMTMPLGEWHEMVDARQMSCTRQWAKTEIKTSTDEDALNIVVRCHDPAAEQMDFSRLVDDFVWGNDNVEFSFVVDGQVRSAKVYLDGTIEKGWDGFAAEVSCDRMGWTIKVRLKITDVMRKRGRVMGNVSRWRVGDRRRPKEERVAGSRYEHSRLNTCYTVSNADPAAFVEFEL